MIRCDEYLTLVPFQDDMAAELFTQVAHNRKYLERWLTWVTHTQTPADSLAFLQRAQRLSEDDGLFRGAVVMNERLLGTIGFHDFQPTDRAASIGYWLDERMTGQGIMTRAVRQLVQYGFETLELHRIELRAATENDKSWRIAERVGFQREGCLRECALVNGIYLSHYVYGLLRSEYFSV